MPAVQLAIYDLSQGLARTLSQQLLGGVQIALVPHCGVVIDRTEYYFGGGIQRMPHSSFVGMHGIQPSQMVQMGNTSKTQAEIDSWLAANDSRFTQATYNLLHHNCNNFADEFLKNGLGITDGVPGYILTIPAQFINSPMGAMVAPMISNFYQPFSAQAPSPAPVPAPFTVPTPALPVTTPSPGGLDFTNLLSNFAANPSTNNNNLVAPPPAPDFSAQLAELELMGFPDKDKNLAALTRSNGNLAVAIDFLVE